MFITVDASAADVAKVTVNRELAVQYAAALNELAEVCGAEAKVTPEQLSRFPDVLTVTKADEDLETVSADLCAVAEQALEAYNAMRAVEGRKLAEDIGNRLTYIEDYTAQVEKRSPETVAEYRTKLTARMEEDVYKRQVVYLIDGDEENLKITTPMDLVVAEAILAELEERT